MPTKLDLLMHSAFSECSLTRKKFGEMVGRKDHFVTQQFNPYNEHKHVRATDLIPLMKATKDIRILEYMAEEMGYRLVRIKRGRPSNESSG